MYGCGLRIGGTLSLKMHNIDLDTGVLILKYTRYCMAMGIVGSPESYLFSTLDSLEPVTQINVKYKFDNILKQAKIALPSRKKYQRGPYLHWLRHAYVFKAFANAEKDRRRIDYTVPYLSIYLEHDSLKETEKYLKFSSELYPEAMELFGQFTQ